MATGKQLRDARMSMKLSAARVAEKVGVAVNTVYAWESDSSKPRNEKVVRKLHDLLGIVVDERGKKVATPPRRVVVVENGKKLPDSVVAAQGKALQRERTLALIALARLVGFFVGDQARRSNVVELLQVAKNHGMTLDDLLQILSGQPAHESR